MRSVANSACSRGQRLDPRIGARGRRRLVAGAAWARRGRPGAQNPVGVNPTRRAAAASAAYSSASGTGATRRDRAGNRCRRSRPTRAAPTCGWATNYEPADPSVHAASASPGDVAKSARSGAGRTRAPRRPAKDVHGGVRRPLRIRLAATRHCARHPRPTAPGRPQVLGTSHSLLRASGRPAPATQQRADVQTHAVAPPERLVDATRGR